MRERYSSLPLSELRAVAKARGLKGISTLRKPELVEVMIEADRAETKLKKEEEKSADNSSDEIPEIAEKSKRSVSETKQSEKKVQLSDKKDRRSLSPKKTSGQKEKADGLKRKTTDQKETSSVQKEKTSALKDRRIKQKEDAPDQKDRVPVQREKEDKEPEQKSRFSAQQDKEPEQKTRFFEQQNREPEQSERSVENRELFDNSKDHTEELSARRLSAQENMKPELSELDSGREANGILEVMADGYGFIRSENFLPGDDDVYVSPSQIRRFGLRTGDIVCGNKRVKSQNERYSALLFVKSVNGKHPSQNIRRVRFEDMTPIFPNERIHLERPDGTTAMRIVDLVSPIGKGQRGMIVSPPKAGKTTLLKDAAKSILRNDPEMHLIILLIDERPEEVTDIRETVCGDNVEVIYSTFDELPEHHKRVSEMVIERAKRLVESHKDVIIFIDSITRLARAYNQVVPPSGRTLSGGLDPAALHMPKRFFGAARNMREGGSLTILATALVETGSKMDDVVYEEFKGTGNMELILDRKLQERRVFPAIDLGKSGTRREDLLLTKNEMDAVMIMRRALNGLKAEEAGENILNLFAHTRTNEELVDMLLRKRFL
ncbi:MAG: transcription termination factor Rho [Eubacterium sp.]|nr:transcription termination factor Rho [Eubacterium sp.]